MSDEHDIFDFADDDEPKQPATPRPPKLDARGEIPKHAKPKEPRTIDADRVPVDEKITTQYEELLRQHDVAVSRNPGVQLLKGAAICFGIAFVLGSIFYLLVLVPVFDFNPFAPFVYNNFSCSATVLIVALIVLPPMFWQESKRADVDRITESGDDFGAKKSLMDRILTGPRLVMQGLGKRGERPRDTAVIQRAASLLGQLHNAGVGISPKSVVIPGEDMAIFDAAVHYLVKRDWAGRKADASKLWISSEAKRRLENSVKVR